MSKNNSEAYFQAELTRIKAVNQRQQEQIDELIKVQADFMVEHYATVEMLRDEIHNLKARLHRLESRGCDE